MDNTRITKLLSFLTQDGQDPFILYALATEYNAINLTDKALYYYRLLVDEHPDYVGTYYHLGKLYEKLGESELALSTMKAGMQVARKKGDHHAYNELQGAYNLAAGLDYEDD